MELGPSGGATRLVRAGDALPDGVGGELLPHGVVQVAWA
jgi:hypothetical protein